MIYLKGPNLGIVSLQIAQSSIKKTLCSWKQTTPIFGLDKQKEWYFVSKIVLTYCEKRIVLVIEKNTFEI